MLTMIQGKLLSFGVRILKFELDWLPQKQTLVKAMLNIFARLGFVEEGVRRKQDRVGSAFVDHILLGCFKDEFKPLLKR